MPKKKKEIQVSENSLDKKELAAFLNEQIGLWDEKKKNDFYCEMAKYYLDAFKVVRNYVKKC